MSKDKHNQPADRDTDTDTNPDTDTDPEETPTPTPTSPPVSSDESDRRLHDDSEPTSTIKTHHEHSNVMSGLPLLDAWDRWYSQLLVRPFEENDYSRKVLTVLCDELLALNNSRGWTNVDPQNIDPAKIYSQRELGEEIESATDESTQDNQYQKLSSSEAGYENQQTPLEELQNAGGLYRLDDIIGTNQKPLLLIPIGLRTIRAFNRHYPNMKQIKTELPQNELRVAQYLASAHKHDHDHEFNSLEARVFAAIDSHADLKRPNITVRQLGTVETPTPTNDWVDDFAYGHLIDPRAESFVIFIDCSAEELDIHNRDTLRNQLTEQIIFDLTQAALIDRHGNAAAAAAHLFDEIRETAPASPDFLQTGFFYEVEVDTDTDTDTRVTIQALYQQT